MKLRTLIPKSEVRKIVLQRRAELPVGFVKEKTQKIISKLASIDEYVLAGSVFCYINSRPGEVDTHKLIDFMEGWRKSIIIPKLNKTTKSFQRFHFMGWDSLVKNNEGYWEPPVGFEEDMSDIDLVIVPALAVSKHGVRIGYGGGYYDKLLRQTRAAKIVLAFEYQIFDYIESTPTDVRVDKIITERRIIDTRDPSKFIAG